MKKPCIVVCTLLENYCENILHCSLYTVRKSVVILDKPLVYCTVHCKEIFFFFLFEENVIPFTFIGKLTIGSRTYKKMEIVTVFLGV